eukprot:2215361-Pyramimonas_sp.AAC.1
MGDDGVFRLDYGAPQRSKGSARCRAGVEAGDLAAAFKTAGAAGGQQPEQISALAQQLSEHPAKKVVLGVGPPPAGAAAEGAHSASSGARGPPPSRQEPQEPGGFPAVGQVGG